MQTKFVYPPDGDACILGCLQGFVYRVWEAFFRYGDEAHDGAGAAGSSDCGIVGTSRPPQNSAKGDPEAGGH